MIILVAKSQQLLIEIQTVANEAYDQIRPETMERLHDRLRIQARRPQGTVARHLACALVVDLSHSD